MKHLSKIFTILLVVGNTVPANADGIYCVGNDAAKGYKITCNCPSNIRGDGSTVMCGTSYVVPCYLSGSAGNWGVMCGEASQPCNMCGCDNPSVGNCPSWDSGTVVQTCTKKFTEYFSNADTLVCDTLANSVSLYRCAAGYYAISSAADGTFTLTYAGVSSASDNCQPCPKWNRWVASSSHYENGTAGTSPVGSRTISSCYIPANSTCKDTNGVYTVSGCTGTTGTGNACN